jgi:hypothetical protein
VPSAGWCAFLSPHTLFRSECRSRCHLLRKRVRGRRRASSHSADLDLVVYVKDLLPVDMPQRFPALLDAIQDAMLDAQYPRTRDTEWYRKYGLRYCIDGMEIDQLIGAPMVRPVDFFNRTREQRAYMSASVGHLATRFI